MKRILAIDFGTVRIGIAVTDTLQMIANGLDTIPAKDIIPFLKKYVSTEPVESFILGESKNLDGTPTDSTQKILVFKKNLEKEFPTIPVVMIDERFTSKMAFRTMIDAGLSKSKRREKGLVDKISAVLILQTYLELKSNQTF